MFRPRVEELEPRTLADATPLAIPPAELTFAGLDYSDPAQAVKIDASVVDVATARQRKVLLLGDLDIIAARVKTISADINSSSGLVQAVKCLGYADEVSSLSGRVRADRVELGLIQTQYPDAFSPD